jgi:4-diphosphocytidyl-2-C-methyl-D-erythritol kinase
MTPLVLSAPAKLNLSLRILGKRPDGFHELETLMVKLPGLADRLVFEPAPMFGFSCSDPTVPADERNLVVKAARLFEKSSGFPLRLQLSLEKTIPHGAGLGGGSSDAALCLLGLNRLHDHPLNNERLHELASALGSDVPFFLTGGAARCTGRGEIVEQVDPPRPLPVLLLKPPFGVATVDAYGRFAEAVELPEIPYAPQNVDGITLCNDLERPVFAKHRFLAETKRWLLRRPEVRAAMMSGSGSTMFAVLHDLRSAPVLIDAARTGLGPTLWAWSGFTGS